MTLPTAWVGVILALATYRILRLLMADTITDGFRRRLLNKDGDVSTPRADWLDDLWGCAYCLGAYVSLVVFAVYELWPHTLPILAVPFALSAAAAMIGKNLDS